MGGDPRRLWRTGREMQFRNARGKMPARTLTIQEDKRVVYLTIYVARIVRGLT